ncbi:MAG: hypothetical protein ITG02_08110 [Patulibacter sp.]|nr:hypothetical protein [Patulibacter sp.]
MTDLLEVIIVGLIAGVGLSIAFAWAIRAVMSAGTARRMGHTQAFAGHAAVATVCLAICIGAVGFAIYSMIHH